MNNMNNVQKFRLLELFSSSSEDSSDDELEAGSSRFLLQEQIEICNEDELFLKRLTYVTKALHRNKRKRNHNYVSRVVIHYMEDDFIMHFRFPRVKVAEIIRRFEATAIYQRILDSPGRDSISATKHILTYLWFAGHQSVEFRDVGDRFDITISSLSTIISRVNAFLISLSPIVIRYPNTELEKKAIRDGFVTRTGTKLRNVMGAIDGSHVRIDRPKADPMSYLNRKSYYSIHLQALCDHNAKFLHVLVGYPGSVHDARVFKESSVPAQLNTFCDVGTYVLGDSAYPLNNNLLTPYRDNRHLTVQQHNFNTELSKARIVIEHSFGQLKQRFRQLYFLKLRHTVRRVEFIHALCVLHNLGNTEDLKALEPPLVEPDANELMVEEVILDPNVVTADEARNALCNDVARLTPANVMHNRAAAARLRRL